MSISAFDHMIDGGLDRYSCDPWCASPQAEHFAELRGLSGLVSYRGQLFVVSHRPGRQGRGGMDEGSPESVEVTAVSGAATIDIPQHPRSSLGKVRDLIARIERRAVSNAPAMPRRGQPEFCILPMEDVRALVRLAAYGADLRRCADTMAGLTWNTALSIYDAGTAMAVQANEIALGDDDDR